MKGVTLSCLLYFLKQQTCVQEKTTSMQLFSLIVSLTIVVVIASGRCPSKSLQIGKPRKLIYSLLFHTFTLQCSLPFPPLDHPWHQENGDSFSKHSIQLEWRNCKWYCTTYWSVKTWLNDFIVPQYGRFPTRSEYVWFEDPANPATTEAPLIPTNGTGPGGFSGL